MKNKILSAGEPGATIIEVDVRKAENALIFLRLKEQLGAKNYVIPSLFANGILYRGTDDIASVMKNADSIGGRNKRLPSFLIEKDIGGESFLLSQKTSLTVPALVAAGLVDGINPCVFSTLVFSFSLLTVMKRGDYTTFLGGALLLCFVSDLFCAGIWFSSGFQGDFRVWIAHENS